MKTTLAALAATLAATTAVAATGIRDDHSGFLVWAFLGLCAMIVVAQLAPAALMAVGMIKGLIGAHGRAEVDVKQ